MGKKLILLLVVLILVTCGFPGCAKLAKGLKAVRPIYHFLEACDSGPFSDSDTLEADYMQPYELYGEKGTVFNIQYKGDASVDLIILDPENYRLYNRLLDDPSFYHGIEGRFYLKKKTANIEFTQPDDQQYYFIIDNTDVPDGAYSGKSVTYSVTISN